ncbi:cytochrome c biogenesis protein ResB [Microbacterium sp. MPKO10]|uniref:cytochrome c biogenesis protein ResB n=1 Tax=Microbacterium sp. MPKO10 TaxID=2989818 RepID=UPI002235816C|nr:cytochrome c biogenesis protein ResB [Microbacterium sp. MPKO10]MCW4456955.1 cytochrome c biogenesis protein ResB [Microbacterium sp. MPKO10]
MSRPSDYTDGRDDRPDVERPLTQPKLGVVGWLRWMWRQLTSMRTALLLLLLLAIAAIPGSLVPQRSSDPNGVTQYFTEHPDLAPVLDKVQMFDVFTSAWFSAVYILLFLSLIGCVIPRVTHHIGALRARPPRTPIRLSRLSDYSEVTYGADDGVKADAAAAVSSARDLLKKSKYRVELYEAPATRTSPASISVSAERGYLRETGNLVFHSALLLILLVVGIGGGFGYTGQRVVVEGQSFVNVLGDYDSFSPGRFFDPAQLSPYALTLDEFDVTYETENLNAYGQAIDFDAKVTTKTPGGGETDSSIKVNDPLRLGGTDIYLLGNGYAPTITVKDPDGNVVFTDSVPFLPQDPSTLTSVGVVKVPDGLTKQVGMVGFFYPTAYPLESGAYTSTYPGLEYPLLTLNVYTGDLGIDGGVPKSVYALDVDGMKPLTGGDTGVDSIELMPGQSTELPNGLGTIEFVNENPQKGSFAGSVHRFASFDIHSDKTQLGVAIGVVFVLLGLLTSLFVPRRRVWVKAYDNDDGTVRIEYAGLARGEDPGLADAVEGIAYRHGTELGVDRE